jgi:UDP-4-amino-4,6-dideoxy-N-acetyl-beta-L-altrosamine transaminase
MIPYGRQVIDQRDVDAVVSALTSEYLTQGPRVPEFEGLIATYCNSAHAFAFNSATSALHAACLALDVGAGDLVWTTPITFVASANCALYCGASVDFVDIDAATYNMSVDALREKLLAARVAGRLPKVVIPVHFAGEPCEMIGIKTLADEFGFKIIEDASHAIGGKYHGRAIGSCEFSDITIFSFHPVKIITTAEGGMASTNCAELARRLSLFRSHGVSRDVENMEIIDAGAWYYEQSVLGFNYRMTELQAALGISQFDRLDDYVASRHQIADYFDAELADLPLATPYRDPTNYSGSHLYVVKLNLESISRTRRQVFDLMREQGIGVNVHYIPVHLQPFYRNFGFRPGDFPIAEDYYARAISLPLHPSLSVEDQRAVVNALELTLI